jgi:hypothetical protein
MKPSTSSTPQKSPLLPKRFSPHHPARTTTMNWQTHRDVQPLPIEPEKRKALILKLLQHPAWKFLEADREFIDNIKPGLRKTHEGFDHCVRTTFSYVKNGKLERDTSQLERDTSQLERDTSQLEMQIRAGRWRFGDFSDEIGGRGLMLVYFQDWRLSTRGSDMEEALLQLARLVECFYDDNGEEIPEKQSPCEEDSCYDDGDGFCGICSFRL